MENYNARLYKSDGQDGAQMNRLIEGVAAQKRIPFHQWDDLISSITGPSLARDSKEKRRMKRIDLKLPILLTGTNLNGGYFSEQSNLEDFSPIGSSFSINNDIDISSALCMGIDRERSNLHYRVRVVRSDRRGEGKRVGVFFEKKL